MIRPTWSLLVIAVALPLLVYFAFSSIGGAVRVYQFQRDVAILRTDAARLETRRQELEQQKLYLQSDQYIEKVAREELNLVKPGDRAVLLLPGDRANLTSEPTGRRPASSAPARTVGSVLEQLVQRFLGSGESRAVTDRP